MREQSGRSLLEVVGVLVLGTVMLATSIGAYNTINQKQKRMIASETMKNIVKDTKTLLEYSGYNSVSVDFLIESGVLKNDHAPIGTDDWSITSNFDGTIFAINLTGLTYDECAYFSTKKFDWATKISVNGYDSSASSFCMKTGDNRVSFFAQ